MGKNLVQVMSDLHLDHHADCGASFVNSIKGGQDITLLLAGDVVSYSTALEPDIIASLSALRGKFRNIVFIPGNHEFYGARTARGAKSRLTRALRSAGFGYPYSLPTSFLGDSMVLKHTLWTPTASTTKPILRSQYSDFSMVPDFEYFSHMQYCSGVSFLEKRIIRPGAIVMTHHSPSYKSMSQRYSGSPLNHLFHNNLDHFIERKRPQLWVHGHTHSHADYKIGDTRVVCNPLGYPGEHTGFRDDLIIEVDS